MKIPVLFYSQVADECVNLYDKSARTALKNRQFEWTDCGGYYDQIETGLVEWELNSEYLPVATGQGNLTANRGVKGENFARWFKNVAGASESGSSEIELKSENGVFSFESSDFQPTSGLFTMTFGVPFLVQADGAEEFEITADDDTFVFVDGKLVIDMGGVHSATTGRFVINENAEVYVAVGEESLAYSGVNLTAGGTGTLRVFHANRDSKDSVLALKISGMAINTTEGTDTVAYDPTNPGYMAPLGVNTVVGINQGKVLAVANAVKGMSFGLIAICSTAIICAVVRYWRQRRNREE